MAIYWRKYKENIIIVLITLLLLCVGLLFQERASVLMEADMEDKLLEITEQMRSATDQKLEGCFAILHSVAASVENGGGSEHFFDMQKKYGDFDALGAVHLDGSGIWGADIDKRYLPLLSEAFRGNEKIVWFKRELPKSENCIFAAVPLMHNNRVIGAVYLIYSEENMPSLSYSNVFDGNGVFLVVDGEFQSANLWDNAFLDKMPSDVTSKRANEESTQRMRQKLYQMRRGVEKYYTSVGETYVACVPLQSVPGRYALTAISASIVLKKINYVIFLMSVVVIGLCFILLGVLWNMENAKRISQAKIYQLVCKDCLTGIDNWQAFSFAGLPEKNITAYVMVVFDIDEFHVANHLLGGDCCNRFLKQTAEMLSKSIEKTERICRVEGDRFALLLAETDDNRLKNRLIQNMNNISGFMGGMSVTLSAGVIRLNKDISLDNALECCILAQKFGKKEKYNSVIFYTEDMRKESIRNKTLVSDLSRAISGKELLVYLQPKVNLYDGTICGAEAFVRWQHPVYGFLCADEFIKQLEDAGVIVRLDFYMFREVCRLLHNWKEKNIPLYPISINLSRAHLSNPELVEDLWEITVEEDISSALIELELTQTDLLVDKNQLIELVRKIKARGFRLSVDDFGSGYSLLGLFPRFELNTVKFGKNLLEAQPEKLSFLTDMVALVSHLCENVVAQGIEDKSQVIKLLEADCKLGQGYYYAHPMPPDGYERLLKNGKGLPYE